VKGTHKDLEKVFGGNKPSKGQQPRPVGHPPPPSSEDELIDDDEASATIATNRPRLVRQSAFFSDEVVIEPEVCK